MSSIDIPNLKGYFRGRIGRRKSELAKASRPRGLLIADFPVKGQFGAGEVPVSCGREFLTKRAEPRLEAKACGVSVDLFAAGSTNPRVPDSEIYIVV
jgi:hypothetical protein